jgi:hypothetical protein
MEQAYKNKIMHIQSQGLGDVERLVNPLRLNL